MALPNHISQEYENQLEDIRSKVLTMGGLVEQHLAKAIDALSMGKAQIADEVAGSDFKVNALELSIDEECTGASPPPATCGWCWPSSRRYATSNG